MFPSIPTNEPAVMPALPPEESRPVQPLTKAQLLEKLKDRLTRLIKEDIDGDVEPERIIQVAMALRNELFWRAKQYLRLDFRGDNSIGYFPIGGNLPGGPGADGAKEQQSFTYVFNITRADGMKFAAVMGQRAPGVKAVPDNVEDERAAQAAREADAIMRDLRKKWKADRQQKNIARHMWRTGPAFVYTPYVSNGKKHGYVEQPSVDTATQEINGIPVQVPNVGQPRKFPKGDVEMYIATILETTMPTQAKTIEEAGWLCYEYDEHKAKLIELYATDENDLRDKLRTPTDAEASAAKTSAIEARDIILSPTATRQIRKNLARFSRYWMEAWLYNLVEEKDLRELLQQNFPDGLKATMVAGELVDLENEAKNDVWAVFKTGTSEQILSDPLCSDLIPIQNIMNNFYNMAVETMMRAIPKTIVDPTLLDRKSIEENEANVAEIIFAKAAAGQDMNKLIASLPLAHFSDQLMPLAKLIRDTSREIDGILEPLFGGGQAAQTFRSDLQRKNQAMMQLFNAYEETVAGWERVYENGVRQRARHGIGLITLPGSDASPGETVDLAALAEEGWHAEAEEGIPITHNEEVERLLFLVNENNPEVAESLELFAPYNLERSHQLLALRGYRSIKVESLKKFRGILGKLLKESPMQQPDASGQMGEAPSIPIDEFEDDHQFMANTARYWMNSPAGQRERDRNPEGYANVRAWGKAHDDLAGPPPEQAGGAAPQGAPKAPPGPPPTPADGEPIAINQMAPIAA